MADHRNWFPGDLGFRTIDELYRSRRRKLALIPEGALLSCLTLSACVPGDVMVKYSLDVPPGTLAVTRYWNASLQGEVIILVNEAWPEIEPGQEPPWLKIGTTPVMVKMDQTRYPDGLTQPFMGKPGITPLRLPFPVPEEKREKFLGVVTEAVLKSGVLSKEDIMAARGFFAAILGVEAVQAALEEPQTVITGIPDSELTMAVGKAVGAYIPKFLDGSEVRGEPHEPSAENPFEKTWREKERLL